MSRNLAALAIFGSERIRAAQLRTEPPARLTVLDLLKLKEVSQRGAEALKEWLNTRSQSTADALLLELAGLRLPTINLNRPAVRVYITLPPELVDRLDELADSKEQTRSSIIRQAIVLGLDDLP